MTLQGVAWRRMASHGVAWRCSSWSRVAWRDIEELRSWAGVLGDGGGRPGRRWGRRNAIAHGAHHARTHGAHGAREDHLTLTTDHQPPRGAGLRAFFNYTPSTYCPSWARA